MKKIKICENCNKEFTGKLKSSRFCSKECYLEHMKDNKKEISSGTVKVTCAFCGKEELKYPYRASKYKCCSRECIGKYNSIMYSKKITKKCVICESEFEIKKSHENFRVCCSRECSNKYQSIRNLGDGNPNSKLLYVEIEEGVRKKDFTRYKDVYRKVACDILNVKKIPKGYHIHHKDSNSENNDATNLIILPKSTHMLLHRWFGNILLCAIENGKISVDIFKKICNDEEWSLYSKILYLDVTKQVILNVKSDILLEEDMRLEPYKYIYDNNI